MMRIPAALVILALVFVGVGRSARCVTVLDSPGLREYESYVERSEKAMPARFGSSELTWVPDSARPEAIADLNAGRQVRWNISDATVNQRAADLNATVIDWVGAVRIRGARIPDLLAVLQDYARYPSIYGPMIYDCRSQSIAGSAPASYDVTFGLQNTYRAASLFPQHYAFQVKARTDYSGDSQPAGATLLVHQRSSEIRESDSGVPGRADFLEPFHDHGILWALNTYWRARQNGPDLYVEFEAITLARAVQDFKCKIGLFPVPKLLVSGAVDSIPSESLDLMLAATKAECERGAAKKPAGAARH
jgi:hypothetical protein